MFINVIPLFHQIAFFGQTEFCDLLQDFYPDIYMDQVLHVKGTNENLILRSSAMKGEYDGKKDKDVFWHAIGKWLKYFDDNLDDPGFRNLLQEVLRGKDKYGNTILLNLVEFERVTILSFIKRIVKQHNDFLHINDITQRCQKNQSIDRILMAYELEKKFCNMHFPNHTKQTDTMEHSSRCMGQETLRIVSEICQLLMSRNEKAIFCPAFSAESTFENKEMEKNVEPDWRDELGFCRNDEDMLFHNDMYSFWSDSSNFDSASGILDFPAFGNDDAIRDPQTMAHFGVWE